MVLAGSSICWLENCAQIGGGAVVAELGGVRFSLSFFLGEPSNCVPFEDFGLDNNAARFVDDFDFLGFLSSFVGEDFDVETFAFSVPIKDLRETELFVFLCSPVLVLLSS